MNIYTGILGLIFFLTPLAYYPNAYASSDFPKAVIFYLTGSLLAVIILKDSIKEKWERADINIKGGIAFFILILLVFVLWMIIVTIFSVRPVISAGKAIDYAAKIAFMLLIFINIKRFSLYETSIWACAGLCIVSVIGIMQHFDIIKGIFAQTASPASTFVNKNHAAHYIGLAIPFAYLLFIKAGSKKAAIISIFIILISMIYAILAQARGLWIGITTSFIYFMILLYILKKRKYKLPVDQLPKYKRTILYASVAVFLVLLFLPGLQLKETFFNKVKTLTADSSARIAVWKNSLELIKDYPATGVGLNCFQAVYPLYSNRIMPTPEFTPQIQFYEAHNDYIQTMAETGIFGELLFLLIVLAVPVITIINIFKNSDRDGLIESIFLSMGLVTVFAHAFFEFPFSSAGSGSLLWPVIGLWAGKISLYKESPPGNKSSRTIINKAAGIISLILMILMAVVSMRNMAGGILLFKATRMFKHFIAYQIPLCGQIEADMNKVVNLMPFYHLAYKWRAHFYAGCNVPSVKSLVRMEAFYRIDPYYTKLWFDLSYFRASLGNVSGAGELLDKYKKIFPDDPNAVMLQGYIYQKMNDYKNADELYAKALKSDPALSEKIKMLKSERELKQKR